MAHASTPRRYSPIVTAERECGSGGNRRWARDRRPLPPSSEAASGTRSFHCEVSFETFADFFVPRVSPRAMRLAVFDLAQEPIVRVDHGAVSAALLRHIP